MIQEIAPHTYDNTYRPLPPEADSYALFYDNHEILLARNGEQIEYPRFRDLEALNPDIYTDYTYLFSIDSDRFYLLNHISAPVPSRFAMANTEIFRTAAPQHLAFAGITGYQLCQWYRDRHYCGRCGKIMVPDQKERMMYCDSCHNMEYPKLSPAVIIGVTDGDRLLLSKYAGRSYKKYALLAGFTEIGETLEETVKREVLEEVGLRVTNIRYYKSQPWSFSGTLLTGFFCDLDGSDQIRLDESELALAEWFTRPDIPVDDSRISLTNEMIRIFKECKNI